MSLNDEFRQIAAYLHDQMIGMAEPQQRVYLHGLLKDRNAKLNALLGQFGITGKAMPGQFYNEGYKQQFDGHTAETLAQQYGIPHKQLEAFMGAEALEGALIRAMQTEKAMSQRKPGTPKVA